MPTITELEPLPAAPAEALDIEYKGSERPPNLVSEPCPPGIAAYDQDLIDQIIRRFAAPTFHCLSDHVRTSGDRASTCGYRDPRRICVPGDLEQRHAGENDPAPPLLYVETGTAIYEDIYAETGAGERATRKPG
jgi:hypothetical protein